MIEKEFLIAGKNGVSKNSLDNTKKSIIHAQYWPARNNNDEQPVKKIIALHGWCDNSASFDAIAHTLSTDTNNPAEVLAIDLPGHGKSYHRQEQGSYVIWQDLYDIYAIAEQMQWTSFCLLGHSRGAMIASLFAGTFPDKVSHLALIEGLLPPPQEAADMPKHLANSIKVKEKLLLQNKNYYPTFEAAVKARENGLFQLSHADALVFAKRGVAQNEKGFFWQYDAMLKTPSEIKLTEEILITFASNIVCPTVLIIAEQGMLPKFKTMIAHYEKCFSFKQYFLPGGHHLHMSEQTHELADILKRSFFRGTP